MRCVHIQVIDDKQLSDDYELQNSGVKAVLELSCQDANVIAIARNQSILDGLVSLLCSSELALISTATAALSNLCRHSDNHVMIASHPSCLHNIAQLLMLNKEDILISVTNIFWNLSARSELRASIAACHTRLFSLLHSTLHTWASVSVVAVATTRYVICI